MKRTTVLLEEDVERELCATAAVRGTTLSVVVREALAEYARTEARKRSRSLRFFAVGRSGRDNIADRHEEILERELGRRAPSARHRSR